MSNIIYIMKRELKAYFVSPIAYIVIAVFLIVSGYFFISDVFINNNADYGTIMNMSVILLFVTPFISMRLIAEEENRGTLELLMTSPITLWQIVLGKFFASLVLILIMFAFTLTYPIILSFYGSPDWIKILFGYFGLVLFGSALLSIGILTSSFNRNQIIAGIIAFAISLILFVINMVAESASKSLRVILSEISFVDHFSDFARGFFDIRHIAFFVMWTILFLYLTTKTIEARNL